MDKYFYQHCKDEELINKFNEFHIHILNQIIAFCKENNITDIDEITLHAFGTRDSIKEGFWISETDSTFVLEEDIYEELDKSPLAVTNEEYQEAKFKHLPYLFNT